MSVIIINNMAMPDNCYECRFCETYLGHHLCAAFLNYIEEPRSGRLETCPLVELPNADEFAERMHTESVKDDEEIAHVCMDDAMCELLKKLGYGEAVKVFEDTPKWYA